MAVSAGHRYSCHRRESIIHLSNAPSLIRSSKHLSNSKMRSCLSSNSKFTFSILTSPSIHWADIMDRILHFYLGAALRRGDTKSGVRPVSPLVDHSNCGTKCSRGEYRFGIRTSISQLRDGTSVYVCVYHFDRYKFSLDCIRLSSLMRMKCTFKRKLLLLQFSAGDLDLRVQVVIPRQLDIDFGELFPITMSLESPLIFI